MRGLGAYGASKAALISWTRVMAQEWTPRGVRVNGLTPGSVATDMILPRDEARRDRFVEELQSQNLFGRIAEPEEMVGPALFLASDASSFMTGQILVVDGGLLA
jgi:NAD(P)-dependent dehydrogenase (short-subunit alcohol dehydrogenase family)